VPSLHPRCAQHGLAVAPDGLCVLCRRTSTPAASPAAQDSGYTPPMAVEPAASEASSLKLLKWGALLLLAAAGAGLALQLTTKDHVPLQPTAASARLPDVVSEHNAEQSALDKVKAADLAASLAMLDRAEADRVKKQQLAAAEAHEQRQVTLAAREQEERERDRARHEAVTRDLDMQAFQKKRGNVQVTLYGTDWCGVCDRARKYMNDKHIPFKDFDIDRDEQARTRAHALNPQGSVPTITINKELMIGFSPDSLEDHIARAAHARKH